MLVAGGGSCRRAAPTGGVSDMTCFAVLLLELCLVMIGMLMLQVLPEGAELITRVLVQDRASD